MTRLREVSSPVRVKLSEKMGCSLGRTPPYSRNDNPFKAKWPFSKRTTPHLFRHLHCFATSLPECLSTLRNALIIAPRKGVAALDKAANSYRQFLKAALSLSH